MQPESGTLYIVAEQPLSQYELAWFCLISFLSSMGSAIRPQLARRDVRRQELTGPIFGPLSSVA
jgi:hypothetical protein